MKFRHPYHEHPLRICENLGAATGIDGEVVVACRVCDGLIEGSSAIGCEDCSHYMHFSCCKLNHPLHAQHPLIPKEGLYGCQICSVSTILSHGCSDSCDFRLCNYCVRLVPPWKFELEGHPFFLVESKNMPGTCLTCGEHSNTMMFKCMSPRCTECFHVQCVPFPLPESIKHPNHWHPLTYTESFVDPNIIGCYCDACEEERDPKIPVYLCEDCNFTSDVTCALTQVSPPLIAEWEARTYQSGQANRQGDPRHVHEIKQKIARLRRDEERLTWCLERIVQELNKAEGRHAKYVASRVQSGK
ncbi:uncharacterized protein LOC116199795 isoform X2 [Punica granatum]|uniref:Uncharacterized protein n=2 Tax=Punica granatum TaxID=22663 RepID=A0A2I0KBR3_PUNGR|nr:uncharacterized protein LOC116199795 isoform X2 [Punica granatum]PKI65974.1 hypothetical protein CRG98_013640 [Punica granatum]